MGESQYDSATRNVLFLFVLHNTGTLTNEPNLLPKRAHRPGDGVGEGLIISAQSPRDEANTAGPAAGQGNGPGLGKAAVPFRSFYVFMRAPCGFSSSTRGGLEVGEVDLSSLGARQVATGQGVLKAAEKGVVPRAPCTGKTDQLKAFSDRNGERRRRPGGACHG